MKRAFFFLSILLLNALHCNAALPKAASLLSNNPKKDITVHNRVLANANGNAISVIDVMKKLDLIFYRQYPEYLNSSEARYHFYLSHWKQILSDLIDRELVMQEAQEKKFEVSNGDIREELEEIFGPNVMINLDNANLTLDEAWQMVKADILIRRMLFFQVKAKVLAQITPKEVRQEYEKYCKELQGSNECVWRSISFRSDDPNKPLLALAREAHDLLVKEKVTPEAVQEKLQEQGKWDAQVTLATTSAFRQNTSELTSQLQELFEKLEAGSYSEPLMQTSRAGGNPIVRIYFLQEKSKKEIPPIFEVENKLKENLAQEMMVTQTTDYFANLRRHFDVSQEAIEEQIPSNFQPFELQ